MNEAEADWSLSEWLGAVFYYLMCGGKKPFNALYSKKYEKRNVLTGYFLKIILVAIGIALLVFVSDFIEG